ncbi:LacI family DNA-binding transcriptional regulator [Microbacterium betulae]|uniref:LacI family DNA-binding transcriptional regulator n=1 Tax=Microbacterium betulae TaxID=2981139 RepID=A0AA97I6Y0_9MICO|nr:LacI family DNA-binding transcriptional regulator [Microbacterium sp. AB]WOF23637.1 LacI family DNA-binding transcriptional regulator [Microbacterium sp. AB]
MAIPSPRNSRRVTLTDIAAACGVAPSTVSRALSNPNRVSPAMYERIVRKARDMGYRSAALTDDRDRMARGSVALVLPNLSNPFNLDVIRGSQAQAQAAGYLHLLVSTEESVHVETTWLGELSRTVDGVVLASPRADDAVIRDMADNVPLVVLNREIEGLTGVLIDTPSGLAQSLDYLVSLGHRRIAYVRGPASSWSDRARFAALTGAAEAHGADLIPVGSFQPSLASGAAAADAVALTPATAAIFFNDTLAIGALQRFRRLGIAVPGRMSVVGCDDIFGASFAHPPLTTVTSPGERAGRDVTDLLIGRLATRDRGHRVDRIAAHLSVRESTGPAPG